MAIQEIRIII